MTKRLMLTFSLILVLFIGFFANNCLAGGLDDEPTMVIHDTVVAPGELLLQLDALHFSGANGQVSAITLKIDIDTNLIQFVGIQNQTLFGSWLANYNEQQNEISIIYTAFSGNGYDIDGKLLDLHLFYTGGFDAPLHFKDGCEVSNVNLQNIDVIYEDGLISQTTAVGNVSQDSIVARWGNIFSMPVLAGGTGYDMVNEVDLRVGYDTSQLEFVGITEALFTNLVSFDTNSIITINWQESNGSVDLTTEDTLLFMNFKFIGDTSTFTNYLPGSKVFNNSVIVASDFYGGIVTASYLVDILREPDTAGETTGEGYFFEGDSVTVVATPNDGFHFVNWTEQGFVVSTDSVFSFVKEAVNDTLTANFDPNSYTLSLFALPPEGGTVLGDGVYNFGELVTVTAIPDEGYDFIAWLFGDDTVSYDPVYSFSMPDYNMSLTAMFQIQSFSITAIPNNINYGSTSGGGLYNYGDTATVVATPFEDYKFVVWTENGQAVSYDSSYSFFVNADRDLFANFQYDAVCSAPVGLYVDSLSDSTAMLHWLSSGEESEWDLVWGEYGFDTLNGGNLVQGLTDNEYYLTNLDAGTVYDFYVRAVCTDEDHSNWAGPYTFTTWYVGIREESASNRIAIFPNPASNLITVDYGKLDAVKTISYRVVNLSGVVEISKKVSTSGQIQINLEKLSQGVYFLQLFIDDQNISRTFIKK